MTLHIYAQPFWHTEAWLVGSRASLAKLRDCIDSALTNDKASCGQFTADGEGYAAIVVVTDSHDGLILPYTDPVVPLTGRGPHTLITTTEYRSLVRKAHDNG